MATTARALVNNLNPEPLTITARRLENKVILITGASAGIGEAAARRFAAEGATVVVGARRTDRLDALVADLNAQGHDALAVALDVADEASVAEAVRTTVHRWGRLDGALNNAGLPSGGKNIPDIDTEYFDRVMAINLRGVFLSLKHQIPALLAAGGGSIVNVSSVGGLVGVPSAAEYVASKWGVIGLTKSAALEGAAAGIRVNAIAPGSTRTEMWDQWLPTEEEQATVASWAPMHQIALPDDMARVALFLLSDESRWTTGTVVAADGGQHVG
jgi:NAD(P)-dependent dehydrogenase (short-subunit alcohol dehydrogenase family)